MVFDISEVGNPQYNVPFVLDLHKPAVTSVEYMNECPDNLTSSLYSVQSKQLVKDNPFKVRMYITCCYCVSVCQCVCVCMCVCVCVCVYVCL